MTRRTDFGVRTSIGRLHAETGRFFDNHGKYMAAGRSQPATYCPLGHPYFLLGAKQIPCRLKRLLSWAGPLVILIFGTFYLLFSVLFFLLIFPSTFFLLFILSFIFLYLFLY
jgi:hypothetical protein